MAKQSISKLYDFSDKTVVVTGGAMGIGYAMVERFHEAGANVVVADVDEKTGQPKVDQLGDKALFVKTDVSQEEEVNNLIKQAVNRFSTIDIFINNAGIFPNIPVMQMTLDEWEKIQHVNLRSVYLCSKAAAAVMLKQGHGGIINIASIDALHPSQIGLAAYDASKHGVWGFTKNFALEVAKQGIRVNAIAPGGISTEGVAAMSQGNTPEGVNQEAMIKQFTAKIPLGRFGEPDEMATIALFLASDASSYMTGSMIVADGGVLLT